MSQWTYNHRVSHYHAMREVLDRTIPSLRWNVYEHLGNMRVSTCIEGHPTTHTLMGDYNIEHGMPSAGLIVDSMRKAWTEIQYDIWRLNAGS